MARCWRFFWTRQPDERDLPRCPLRSVGRAGLYGRGHRRRLHFDALRSRRVSGPLAGMRVLDCSTMIAAPSTAAMLADFGAEVVKLERPGSGDHVRRYGALKNGIGLYWKALARNKKSVALDLHVPAVQTLLLRWLPQF